MNKTLFGVLLVVLLALFFIFKPFAGEKNILVFSKTEGFRHDSIADGHAAIKLLGSEHNINVDSTENALDFTDENLAKYDAVVFLSTTGDVLDASQQIALQRFIQSGGGFVGIHAASDTEYGWPWYGQLVGAYFDNHPAIQEARLMVSEVGDPSTSHLDSEWMHTDEWYNHRNMRNDLTVLVSIDETTYDVGKDLSEGDTHPVSWKQEFDGGRMFYTNLGHRSETWQNEAFLTHLLKGIEWAMEEGQTAPLTPLESEFTQQVLGENFAEPMEIASLPDGRLLLIERGGAIHLFDPAGGTSSVVDTLRVNAKLEDGLLGVAVDPNFASNNWIYLYYSAPGEIAKQNLSRFDFTGDHIQFDSEKILLEVPTQRAECCHAGGSVEFDSNGNLYVSTGDNTNPFASDGFSPSDESPGRAAWDAQGSSANSRDLRGKILRIKPTPEGSYTIPEGNLFADGAEGAPEVYVMGNRNPFRISLDSKTNWLYWGEVGPDATEPVEARGPAGHDEINQARQAGFFGWPYFVGNNKAYVDYNFATKTSGASYDADRPVNDSPNNTGTKDLPPAQPAFIWYPYGASTEFPIYETGGRTAMAGPVFHASDQQAGFPVYFEGKLFVYEWMRHKLFLVTMHEDGSYYYMESFLPSTKLVRPMDLTFGPDGALYVLEYGDAWNSRNADARLSRITYSSK